MKTRVFHRDIKCSPYKGILGQPIKVGLKTSNPHEDAGCSGRNFHIFREDLDKTDQNKLIITILQKIMLSKRMMEKNSEQKQFRITRYYWRSGKKQLQKMFHPQKLQQK